MSGRRIRWAGTAVLALHIAMPASAYAQQPVETTRFSRFSTPPTDVELLIGCQAVLHLADMVTTAYDLSLSDAARERNPLLGPLDQHPTALVAVSGAIDILEAYVLTKIQHKHPKIARWWALGLVGVEVWATINNINRAGELQRARATP